MDAIRRIGNRGDSHIKKAVSSLPDYNVQSKWITKPSASHTE